MINQLKTFLFQHHYHDGFIRYFKNTSWLFIEKLLRLAVGLLVGVWVVRYLGPEQFGLFSYVQSFVGLFVAISTLGLDGIVTRELIKNKSKKDAANIIATSFWLKILGAFLSLIMLDVAVNVTSNDLETNWLVFIVASSAIFQSFNVIEFYFRSKVMSKIIVYVNIISLFISSVIKIILMLNNAPLIAFAWVVLFDSFVLAVGFVYFLTKKTEMDFSQLRFNKVMAVKLLRDSWPYILSGTALMIQARVDQVMIKEMIGLEEVGYYSAAMRLIEMVAFIPIIFSNSLYPSIENAKQVSNELYQNRLLNFYRLNFIAFLVIGIPIFLFSEQVVVLLFGKEYQPAGILLALMAVRLFFANMGVARGVYILSENLVKFSLLTMVIGTVVNVGLNYLWIPIYGAKGAIVATIVSFVVTIFVIDLVYSKTRNNALLQLKSILTFYKIKLR